MQIITSIKFRSHGFTLVEMAIVLMIVGLLLGGLLVPLSAQMEQRNVSDTRKTLDEIQQALIGYAIINDRLPCPASSTNNGVEDPPVVTGTCNHPNDGFVPAATLGLTQVDSQGFAVDAWNNRIHYAVTSSYANAFTTTGGMKATGLSSLTNLNLLVCSTASASGTSCSVANSSLTSNGVPAVIYSTGKNGGSGGAGTDEAANLDGNNTFVSHTPTPTFDDLVVWISPNILLNRMVAAGKLP